MAPRPARNDPLSRHTAGQDLAFVWLAGRPRRHRQSIAQRLVSGPSAASPAPAPPARGTPQWSAKCVGPNPLLCRPHERPIVCRQHQRPLSFAHLCHILVLPSVLHLQGAGHTGSVVRRGPVASHTAQPLAWAGCRRQARHEETTRGTAVRHRSPRPSSLVGPRRAAPGLRMSRGCAGRGRRLRSPRGNLAELNGALRYRSPRVEVTRARPCGPRCRPPAAAATRATPATFRMRALWLGPWGACLIVEGLLASTLVCAGRVGRSC